MQGPLGGISGFLADAPVASTALCLQHSDQARCGHAWTYQNHVLLRCEMRKRVCPVLVQGIGHWRSRCKCSRSAWAALRSTRAAGAIQQLQSGQRTLAHSACTTAAAYTRPSPTRWRAASPRRPVCGQSRCQYSRRIARNLWCCFGQDR